MAVPTAAAVAVAVAVAVVVGHGTGAGEGERRGGVAAGDLLRRSCAGLSWAGWWWPGGWDGCRATENKKKFSAGAGMEEEFRSRRCCSCDVMEYI